MAGEPRRILVKAGVAFVGRDLELLRSVGIYIEDGVVASIEGGNASCTGCFEIDLRSGAVLPPLVNLHAHSADYGFAELGSDLDVDSLVGEPYGAKYVMLRMRSKEVPSYIEGFLHTQALAGVGAVADFREGGVEGLEHGLEASKSYPGLYFPMAMPSLYGGQGFEEEVRSLLRMSMWIGISSPHYYSEEELTLLDREAARLGAGIASHVAETEDTRREGDLERIANLRSLRLVVHGINLSEEELAELASKNVGLAVCPRSNMWFSRPPDLERISRSGILAGIGTDNGGWVRPDMWRDMELLALISRQQGAAIDPVEILRMATVKGAKILGFDNFIEEGAAASLIGLSSPWLDMRNVVDPAYAVVKRGGPESLRIFISPRRLWVGDCCLA